MVVRDDFGYYCLVGLCKKLRVFGRFGGFDRFIIDYNVREFIILDVSISRFMIVVGIVEFSIRE